MRSLRLELELRNPLFRRGIFFPAVEVAQVLVGVETFIREILP